jgi:hypothetical protein
MRPEVRAGFVDPSGGSVDSFTCAIAHCDHVRNVVLIDAVREIKAPFSPEAPVSELATLLKSYRVYKVHGDKYAGEWPRESFAKFGISYEPSPQPKSGLYTAFLLRAEGMAKRGDEWFPLSQAVLAYDHARHAPLGDVITLDFINIALEPGARAGIELTLETAKELRAALDRAIAAAEFEEAEVRGKGAVPSLVRAA